MENSRPFLLGGVVLGFFLVGGGAFLFWRSSGSTEAPVEVPPTAEEMPHEVFNTADSRLSFEYPAAWTQTEIKNLETILPKNFVDKYQLTMPLILSDPRGAQISLSVYRFASGTSLEAAMDSFLADLGAMGQPYNEVTRQLVGEALVVDSTVDAGQEATVKVRDLLFLVPGADTDTIYNLSFSSRQDNWSEYETVFGRVQNSAQIFR